VAADGLLHERPAGVAELIGEVELTIVLRGKGNASAQQLQLLAPQHNAMICHVVALRTCHLNPL